MKCLLVILGFILLMSLVGVIGQICRRCKHEWRTQVDRLTPSWAERMSKLGQFECERLPYGAAKATHTVILVCTKCGKVNKTTTEC